MVSLESCHGRKRNIRNRTCDTRLNLCVALPLSHIPHNRHQTVSTRIYRAMRDTIRFVLPLLLSGLGGFFAFFSVCRKHREKPTWNTMFQAIWLAHKTALFHFRQILLLRFFLMELKYGLCVHKFCHALHESPYSCSNSGVQELTLPFLNQKLSVSPLKPTPEPFGGQSIEASATMPIAEL